MAYILCWRSRPGYVQADLDQDQTTTFPPRKQLWTKYRQFQLEEILFVLPRVWTVDQPALPCPSMTVGRGHLLVLSAAAQAVLDGQFTVYSEDFDLTWSIYHNIVFAALAARIFPGGLETCSRGAADP